MPPPTSSNKRKAAEARNRPVRAAVAPMNVVGPTVRRLRAAKGWSQEALAAKLQIAGWDCTRSWLAKVESGQVLVRDHQLLHLCAVLRVSLEELFRTLVPKRALRRR